MADVAELAGVSHQTVWRVVNGVDGVKQSTREAVLDAIERLGYRRNLAASRLATSRSTVIGILAPATADYGPTSSLYAVEHSIRDAGYHPLITSTEPGRAADSLDFLLDQSVQALVVIAPYRSTLQALEELRPSIPVVILQAGSTSIGPSIAVDQAAGVRLVVRHLTELGHRRIQHIAGPPDFIEAGLRREAFEREIRRAGLEPVAVIQGDWSAASGFDAARLLDPATTAVSCGNDQMAIGFIHGLVERGLRVPHDVAVVGFDDVPEAAHSLPPLTTVHQDFAEVGRRAVAALLVGLGGETAKVGHSVRPGLVLRASTSRVRG